LINQSELIARLDYNLETGIFVWKVSAANNKVKIGDVAGNKTKTGYCKISICGEEYYAHRLAFLYVKGYMPDVIDHINRDRFFNAFGNLRESSYTKNQRNRSLNSNNKTGTTGVTKSGNKYCASIKLKGIKKHLGTFSNKTDAINARINAEIKHNFREENL